MPNSYQNGVKKDEGEEEEYLILDSEEEGGGSSSDDERLRINSSSSSSSSSSRQKEKQEQAVRPPRRRASKKNTSVMQFGQVLVPPIPVRYSCGALVQMIEKGQIDLEAEYQRGIVWSHAKQSAVIDSLFRNCYVPPILFSIHTVINEEGDAEERRICVDGKQVRMCSQ
jgi:hypothetical protein